MVAVTSAILDAPCNESNPDNDGNAFTTSGDNNDDTATDDKAPEPV